MNSRLFIVGTGGYAKEAAQLAHAVMQTTSRWKEIAFLGESDVAAKIAMPFGEVVGTDELLLDAQHDLDVVIGVGSPKVRQELAARLAGLGHLRFPNLFHPRMTVSFEYLKCGVGNLFHAGSAVECDVVLGDFNVFNLNTTVGHDSVIGSCNVFNPGCNISGNVRMGDGCLVGTGCQVLEKLSVPSRTTLGAGSVLVKSIDVEGGVYVGVPARQRQ
ncbi:MAG: acetyltransferase [Methylibium sp.]|nr:acetyltransferase [Methylibium sp.]